MVAFVSVALPVRSGRRPKQTCSRRSYVAAMAGQGGPDADPSWEQTPNYQTMGSGVPSSGLQRIEFIIRQDGTVEETVTGVRGKHCEKVCLISYHSTTQHDMGCTTSCTVPDSDSF